MATLGLGMWSRERLDLTPQRIKNIDQLKAILKKAKEIRGGDGMNKYLFYPGCSLQRNARAYLDSTMAIREDINIVLEEVQDWNCCGATEYKSVYRVPSHALVGRNLALAEQQIDGADTLVASCSACYLNLVKTESHMRHDVRV